MRSWISAFVRYVGGEDPAKFLLEGAGVLSQPLPDGERRFPHGKEENNDNALNISGYEKKFKQRNTYRPRNI